MHPSTQSGLVSPASPRSTKRRLWHQLTVALLEFVSDPANAEAGGGLVRLCTEFVAKFEAKLNQLRFVQILCAVGKTCSGNVFMNHPQNAPDSQ